MRKVVVDLFAAMFYWFPMFEAHKGHRFKQMRKRLGELDMKRGRKPIYSTPEELEEAVETYFERQDKFVVEYEDPKTGKIVKKPSPKPYTIAGLVLAIGFSSQATFYVYASKPEFCDIINRALLRIEEQLNESLVSGKSMAAGQIFALKNCFGWTEFPENPCGVHNIQINVGAQLPASANGLPGLPPAPTSLEEWESWYKSRGGKPQSLPAGEDDGDEDVQDASYVQLPTE